MSDRFYEEQGGYREPATSGSLSPAAPALIWGAVMVAALAGAAVTISQASGSLGERLVQAGGDLALRRDMAKLALERDALAGRLAALERDVAQTRTARRGAVEPETTGSIARPAVVGRIGLSLGMESSIDAAKRRWTALAARFPQQLANLAPRVQRATGPTALFDLVAGPFATREDADRICGALAEQSLACDTTEYAGEPIGRP